MQFPYLRVSFGPHNQQPLFRWTVMKVSAVWKVWAIFWCYLHEYRASEWGDVRHDLQAQGHSLLLLLMRQAAYSRVINNDLQSQGVIYRTVVSVRIA